MHPLGTYYLNEAVRGLFPTPVIGPIYSAPLYLQRGHGISNFLGTLPFRATSPVDLGRTGGKIITDIAKSLSRRACQGYHIETFRRCSHRIHTV